MNFFFIDFFLMLKLCVCVYLGELFFLLNFFLMLKWRRSCVCVFRENLGELFFYWIFNVEQWRRSCVCVFRNLGKFKNVPGEQIFQNHGFVKQNHGFEKSAPEARFRTHTPYSAPAMLLLWTPLFTYMLLLSNVCGVEINFNYNKIKKVSQTNGHMNFYY